MTFKQLFAGLISLLLLFTSTACQTNSNDTDDPRPLTVILDYVVNTNHSGLYVALDKGYYADEGLDVTIIEPADGVTLQLVAAGRGEIGVTYQEDLTYALSSDEPLPLKAIATILQNNTSGFVSAAAKNITSPADFTDKTYTGWGSPSETAVIHAVMQPHGANPESIRPPPVRPASGTRGQVFR